MERALSRKSKGARLWLRPARTDADGIVRAARWFILDGTKQIGTGIGEGEGGEAEKRLAEYIAAKHAPPRRERALAQIPIADVIAVYLDDVVPGQARPQQGAERAERLLEFFGDKTLDDVTGKLCREYVEFRRGKRSGKNQTGRIGSTGGARRDLEDLRAAIKHHHKEGLHREDVEVVLPVKGPSRARWLTRSEVARLLWVCLRTKEVQAGAVTVRRPLRHLARFILLGVYTGSRLGAILGLNWERAIGRGRVDLEHRLIYRRPDNAVETAKRRPPVPIGPELERILRYWARRDNQYGPVVRFNGEAVLSVKVALKRACRLAGLDETVTAYTLRHTTASWLIQRGASTRKVAEFLGTSEKLIEDTYGHLAPEHLREEAAMIGRKPHSLAEPLAEQNRVRFRRA